MSRPPSPPCKPASFCRTERPGFAAGAFFRFEHIWDRVIQPQRSDPSPDAARSILNLPFDPRDRERMHELALNAHEGTLTQ